MTFEHALKMTEAHFVANCNKTKEGFILALQHAAAQARSEGLVMTEETIEAVARAIFRKYFKKKKAA